MSYQLTTIAQYGVRLDAQAARAVFLDISEQQFQAELASESEDIYEDWERSYVGSWLDIELERDESDQVEFFCKYRFCERLVPKPRQETTVIGEVRGVALQRYRYGSDFRCDSATLSDHRYYAAGIEHHLFGIYLASNGYGDRDDLNAFTRPVARVAIDKLPRILRTAAAPARYHAIPRAPHVRSDLVIPPCASLSM